MSNLFKKVRIVHSSKEQCYYIEQKNIWAFRWEKVGAFYYVDFFSTSPNGCHNLAGDAFDKAKKQAEMLLARTVVWEQSNFTWRP